MPVGRPITSNTRKAQRDRERKRQVREKERPIHPNPAPLERVIQQLWRTS